MSDDGASAIVVIALLGNPFSPGYARGRVRAAGSAPALDYCAMNVALYGRSASAWALTEQGVRDADRVAGGVAIGKSAMRWAGDALVIDIDETSTPGRSAVKGRVVLRPEARTGAELALDDRGQHRWWPVAPLARIDVDLPQPGARFSGHGYHDANAGEVPLEETFDSWSWSRARGSANVGALLTYDAACRAGTWRSLAFKVSARGDCTELGGLWSTPLPRTLWGLARDARVDDGHSCKLVRSLEDGPFYARALVAARLGGEPVVAVHEALAAHRLRRGWVRALTGFRMRGL